MKYLNRLMIVIAVLLFGNAFECAAGYNPLEKKLYDLEKKLERALKYANTPEARARVCQKYRYQVSKMVTENSQYADVKYISSDSAGVVYKVVRPGRDAKISDNEYIYVYGGRAPKYRSYPKTVYPTGQEIKYGKYGKIVVYGESVASATQRALDNLAEKLGKPALFLKSVQTASPAASAEKQTQVTNNDIFIEKYEPVKLNTAPIRVKKSRYRPARRIVCGSSCSTVKRGCSTVKSSRRPVKSALR